MRIAALCISAEPFSYVWDWAQRSGHDLTLLITMPTPANDLLNRIGSIDASTTVLVTPEVAACGPVLASHDCDLAIVASFRIIDAATAAIPRHGMVNLHPSALPAYAGANGVRQLYSDTGEVAHTLHWLIDAVDGGPILAQAALPVPEDLQPARALELLRASAATVLDAGVPRALAGAAGTPQGPSIHPATRFTEAECRLEPTLSRRRFQARFCALCIAGLQPTVLVGGEWRAVRSVSRIDGVSAAAPGVVHQAGRRALLATEDGLLELELGPVAIV